MPIDVSARLQELLFDELRAAVLTSATLAVDGGFAYLKDRLGHRAHRRAAAAVALPLRGAGACSTSRGRCPSRSRREFVDRAAEEVVRLLELSRGRAFVLFTSYANMNAVAERIAGRVDYPILIQGEAPKAQLLDTFRATPHAVLLATASFWQGVDVAGEQLSCVIVDKLPFASPGDPVVAARIERLRSRGQNAFGEYQVPVAVLMLKQGLGRLIRSASDRGILAVLDSRLLQQAVRPPLPREPASRAPRARARRRSPASWREGRGPARVRPRGSKMRWGCRIPYAVGCSILGPASSRHCPGSRATLLEKGGSMDLVSEAARCGRFWRCRFSPAPAVAHASGFAVESQGARAMGFAGRLRRAGLRPVRHLLQRRRHRLPEGQAALHLGRVREPVDRLRRHRGPTRPPGTLEKSTTGSPSCPRSTTRST